MESVDVFLSSAKNRSKQAMDELSRQIEVNQQKLQEMEVSVHATAVEKEIQEKTEEHGAVESKYNQSLKDLEKWKRHVEQAEADVAEWRQKKQSVEGTLSTLRKRRFDESGDMVAKRIKLFTEQQDLQNKYAEEEAIAKVLEDFEEKRLRSEVASRQPSLETASEDSGTPRLPTIKGSLLERCPPSEVPVAHAASTVFFQPPPTPMMDFQDFPEPETVGPDVSCSQEAPVAPSAPVVFAVPSLPRHDAGVYRKETPMRISIPITPEPSAFVDDLEDMDILQEHLGEHPDNKPWNTSSSRSTYSIPAFSPFPPTPGPTVDVDVETAPAPPPPPPMAYNPYAPRFMSKRYVSTIHDLPYDQEIDGEPDAGQDLEAESKPEAEAEPNAEAELEPKPKVRGRPKGSKNTKPKVDPKPKPEPKVKGRPKGSTKPKSEADPKVNGQSIEEEAEETEVIDLSHATRDVVINRSAVVKVGGNTETVHYSLHYGLPCQHRIVIDKANLDIMKRISETREPKWRYSNVKVGKFSIVDHPKIKFRIERWIDAKTNIPKKCEFCGEGFNARDHYVRPFAQNCHAHFVHVHCAGYARAVWFGRNESSSSCGLCVKP